ncbi:uncharacterized protein BT62DRAFT_926926 [Guyanagaster necrorhizus]|uniref:Uncharacterized protein n=1 Tax=Guyanagaster necrorhizus TaxID=856835 RepID=A0A9P8AYT8_9AGAR|nr:uncharacterized protein BT62DRAFT_926926 [Guyanagaster necrorhizus MCA 3950]KAG7451267.1 hypothetical protein BT62DRAFT_926926 [Guyanagaster necrorhizus MCA 3950]
MDLENDVVVDSEGEDEYFPLPSLGSPAHTRIQRPTVNDSISTLGIHQGDSSHISEYTSKPSSHLESISVFASKPQISSQPVPEIPSEPVKSQRPRPRPIYKMKQAPSISDISVGDFSAGSVLNIADRAKMRSRAPKPSKLNALSSKSSTTSGISLGVIDISSDDGSDELNSLPKGKPNTRKGKQVSRTQKVTHNASKFPQCSPHQPTSPTSKLPSYPSFISGDKDTRVHYDHPSIATLIESNTSPRGSSPLPSRRRLHAVEGDDVCDQLDSDMPSAFFASSSPGPDKPAEYQSHPSDVPSLSPSIPAKKDKPTKKGRKKDTKQNEEEEPKGKSRSKEKKTKETKSSAAAKTKGKGKKKEIFKSSESIEDDSIHKLEPFSILTEPSVTPDQADSSSGPPMTVEDPAVISRPGRKRKEATSDEAGGKTGETSEKKRKTEGMGKIGQSKAKAKMVILSDDEDTSEHSAPYPDEVMQVEETDKQIAPETRPASTETAKGGTRENLRPKPSGIEAETSIMQDSDTPKGKDPSLISRHSIAPRFKPTPMSELIRRVNSLPSSPFPVGRPGRSIPGTAYSPYLKSNKMALSRIAPLHPNRRTPPAPLPPPPAPKKTKKEREREEQWEEELIEEVGGMTEWVSMTDVERRDMRRMKREREMGGWED